MCVSPETGLDRIHTLSLHRNLDLYCVPCILDKAVIEEIMNCNTKEWSLFWETKMH